MGLFLGVSRHYCEMQGNKEKGEIIASALFTSTNSTDSAFSVLWKTVTKNKTRLIFRCVSAPKPTVAPTLFR